MKRLLVLLSLCLVFSSVDGFCAKDTARSSQNSMESVLNTAVHSLDNQLMNILTSLELTAMTSEAKSGNWQGIKTYLVKLEERLPGVYFYVLPDGNYYSADKDFTNLNIGNRGYFQSLFAGNQVKGFPIYSRSTGKKSAVMASPVVAGDRVIGAMGASVYLDNLHRQLNRTMALPDGWTWFVVNSAGQTMLDRDNDFIFMNVFTSGSKSLKEGITGALKDNKGNMRYELGGVVRHALYQKLPNLDWWMILARIEGGKVKPPAKFELSLKKFVPQLQSALSRIDATLSKCIDKNHDGVNTEAGIRKLLSDIISKEPAIITASYIDVKGTLSYIEPREYKNVEGSDISSQEHVAAMLKKPEPIFSRGFQAVEGFEAVVIAHPLDDFRKNYNGSVNLILRPEFIVQPLLKNLNIPAEYELWIMQTDGRIIYDPDSEEIGRMLFSDPLYADFESLLKLGRTIAAKPSGTGEYIFQAPGSKNKVIKNASWDTVKLHDREWRVILTHRPYEK